MDTLFQQYPAVLPIFIFFRPDCGCDTGTIRIILLSRGWKNLAPIIGFFEVFIWVVAINQPVRNMSNVMCYLAYASGFAVGNCLGM